jgi:hypothetical protein
MIARHTEKVMCPDQHLLSILNIFSIKQQAVIREEEMAYHRIRSGHLGTLEIR